jgi:hypothetical protein
MLYWNDPHDACFSDEGHSRKAYMMRVFPEKHA